MLCLEDVSASVEYFIVSEVGDCFSHGSHALGYRLSSPDGQCEWPGVGRYLCILRGKIVAESN